MLSVNEPQTLETWKCIRPLPIHKNLCLLPSSSVFHLSSESFMEVFQSISESLCIHTRCSNTTRNHRRAVWLTHDQQKEQRSSCDVFNVFTDHRHLLTSPPENKRHHNLPHCLPCLLLTETPQHWDELNLHCPLVDADILPKNHNRIRMTTVMFDADGPISLHKERNENSVPPQKRDQLFNTNKIEEFFFFCLKPRFETWF